MRVLVTGIGVISSIGNNKNEYFQNLCDGICGVREVQMDFPFHKKRAHLIPSHNNMASLKNRMIKIAIKAAKQAFADANLMDSDALLMGTVSAMFAQFEKEYIENQGNIKAINDGLSCIQKQELCNLVAEHLNIKGARNTIDTACASGTTAVGYGYRLIKRKRASVILCGGIDMFRILSHIGLSAMRIIASDFEKPFDQDRRGILIGEGAGFLVLESEEHARMRNVKGYCYISGYGQSCDAVDLAHPCHEGAGMKQAMIKALVDAKIYPEQVNYINSHGTGTIFNDKAEMNAIRDIFSENTNFYVNSIKGATGHTFGGAGVLEAISTIQTIQHNKIFGTSNLKEKDKEFSHDNIVGNKTISTIVNCAISNSFGFGGNNATLVFSKLDKGKEEV